MDKIRLLESELINQIAAGEVVERPASVIKELIENSIDAGSSLVEIFVRDAGQSYVCVKDNGCGMSKEDLELCVRRHATSKLTGKNLLEIHSFGFRGEALPSICSISRVEIKTKQAQDEIGWLLKIDGGNVISVEPTNQNIGTTITIRDLFYTTPARLKFLKSNSSELSNCSQNIKNLALSNPNITLSLSSNDKNLFRYDAVKVEGLCEITTERVKDILGDDFSQNGFFIENEYENMHCFGWLCLPTYHTTFNQYCFVNKRPIKDKTIVSAVKIGYQDVIIPGEQPSFVIFLNIPTEDVDMNVHPAKTEVRFRNSAKIRSFIINTVKRALEKFSAGTSSHLENNFLQYSQPNRNYSRAYSPTYHNCESAVKEVRQENPGTFDFITEPVFRKDYEEYYKENPAMNRPMEGDRNIDLGLAKAQIFESYILSQNKDSLFLIDQHAAHERIVYENVKEQLIVGDDGFIRASFPKQKLLIPERVELCENEMLAIDDNLESINQIGFCVEKQEGALLIKEVPLICANSDVKNLLKEMIKEIINADTNSVFLEKIHKIFATHACHNSIRANHRLSLDEMNALLRQMETTARSGQCNHGRPSYVKITNKNIEKLFERT